MRALADRQDLPAIPDLPTLREGDSHPGVPAVRQWLVALGDAPAGDPSVEDVTRYDAGLAASVRRFQQRHGRKADGVLGKTTLSDLRVPPARRAAQIELAMERLRSLPAQFADRFIVVNVPEFRLRAFDRGTERPRLTMEVVVGKAARRTETPIMQADMKAVVFRPFWRVPPEIVKKEILPKAEEEPDYLERQHMEVLDGGRVRQRPGPDNALGLVKFLLPSAYHVYLHDTPAKQLFSRSRRDFSHGCIRVADAVALAEFVLQGTWDRERIVEAMERGADSTRVELPAPVPVYLLYTTVVVEPDGRAFFFDDIYGHDARLAQKLAIR
jgi:murein L,D-transpeptidase YcbB/YkuD